MHQQFQMGFKSNSALMGKRAELYKTKSTRGPRKTWSFAKDLVKLDLPTCRDIIILYYIYIWLYEHVLVCRCSLLNTPVLKAPPSFNLSNFKDRTYDLRMTPCRPFQPLLVWGLGTINYLETCPNLGFPAKKTSCLFFKAKYEFPFSWPSGNLTSQCIPTLDSKEKSLSNSTG